MDFEQPIFNSCYKAHNVQICEKLQQKDNLQNNNFISEYDTAAQSFLHTLRALVLASFLKVLCMGKVKDKISGNGKSLGTDLCLDCLEKLQKSFFD